MENEKLNTLSRLLGNITARLQQEKEQSSEKCEGFCYGLGLVWITTDGMKGDCNLLSEKKKHAVMNVACDLASTMEEELKQEAEKDAHRYCQEKTLEWHDNNPVMNKNCFCEDGHLVKYQDFYNGWDRYCYARCGWKYEGGTCREKK